MLFHLHIYWIYCYHSSHYYDYALQLIAQGKNIWDITSLENCNALKWQFDLFFMLIKSGANLIFRPGISKNLFVSYFFHCIKLLTKKIFTIHMRLKRFIIYCLNRHPDYQPNTCFAQSCSPRFSILPTILIKCIFSLIGGCTRQCQPSKHFLVLKTSWRNLTRRLQGVLEDKKLLRWRRLEDMSSRRPEDISLRYQDVLEDEKLLRWRRLEVVLRTCLDVLNTCLQDVLETKKIGIFVSKKCKWVCI